MLVVAMACVAGALSLLVYVVAARPKTVATPSPVEAADVTAVAVAASPEALAPLFTRLGRLGTRLTPARYEQRLQHKLDLAGNPRGWAAQRVLAYKALGLIMGLLLGVLVGARHGAVVLLLAPGVGALGFVLPDLYLRVLGERRRDAIIRGLPDATDMMTVCVEAGLGFDAALARVARTLEGPVAEEFARVLQETQFGLSRSEALRALGGRTAVSELRSFATALVQASELGISVADVLREQAHEMRVRRRQRAEEKAQKLPVKILMPLIACLLPAIFVVALGPAVIGIIHSFGSGGGFLQ